MQTGTSVKRSLALSVLMLQGHLVMSMTATTAPVDPGDSQLSCLLEPSQLIAVSSAVSGVVKAINSERGERVKRDQVLLVLEDSVEKAVLARYRAKSEFAERKVERNQELLEKNLLADFERDEIITELELAELDVREAKTRLKQRTIHSPVNGVVVARKVSVSEHVGEDPLFQLASLTPIYAEVVMRAEHYGSITKGMPVTVHVSGAMAGQHSGVVTVVDQVIDAASGTFGVRVELPNEDSALPAGLDCYAHFSP